MYKMFYLLINIRAVNCPRTHFSFILGLHVIPTIKIPLQCGIIFIFGKKRKGKRNEGFSVPEEEMWGSRARWQFLRVKHEGDNTQSWCLKGSVPLLHRLLEEKST